MHTRTTLLAAALFAVLAPSAVAQTFTWDGGAGNGNWSADINWIPDGAPPPGGGAGVTIVLDGTVQTTTVQNLATPFVLNQLHMQANATNGFIVNGNQLQFAGGGAIIDNFINAQLRVNAPIDFSVATTINHQASFATGAEVVLGGRLTGSGTVSTATGSPGTFTTIASKNNTTFTGGWTAGNSSVTQIAAHNALFRGTAVTIGGAAAGMQTGTTLAGSGADFGDAGFNVQLGSVAVAAGGQFAVGTPASPSTVLAGFNNANTSFAGTAAASFSMANAGSHFGKVGTGTTTFTANNASIAGSFSIRDGQVTISGGSGSIANGASPQGLITVYPGATLLLDNTAALNQNRLGNTAPIGLAGGTLRLNGNNGGTAGSEVISTLLIAAGQSVVEANPTAAQGVRFNINTQLLSNPTATVFFRGAGLGSAAWNAAAVGNITVTGALPPLVGNILPFAVGAEANGADPDTFVTHGANGFRPLIGGTPDYTTFAAAGPTSNVSDGGFLVAPDRTINALRMTGAVTLNNNLTLTAGALLTRPGGTLVSGTGSLIFGTAGAGTAYITNPTPLTISSPVQAANLAKSGAGTLTITTPVALGNDATAAVNAGTLVLGAGGITAANGNLTYQISRGATLDVTAVGLTVGNTQTLRGNGTVLGVAVIGNGGTVTPSALSGSDATLASPGTLAVGNMVWQPGGNYRVYLNSAFEGPYTSGRINGTGTLDLNGLSSGNTFNIRLDSLALANTDGPVYDFDTTQPYTWNIASFTGGINGFAADKFTINTADFANALDGGSFSISQQGNFLVLTFAPVPEPGLILGVSAAAGLALAGLRRARRAAPTLAA